MFELLTRRARLVLLPGTYKHRKLCSAIWNTDLDVDIDDSPIVMFGMLTECISLTTAFIMGHIIAAAAELEIHKDIPIVQNVRPKCNLKENDRFKVKSL